jgi:hypothetical protein
VPPPAGRRRGRGEGGGGGEGPATHVHSRARYAPALVRNLDRNLPRSPPAHCLDHIILTSPHITSPHITSLHITSPHITSPHITSPHITSPHITSRTSRPTHHVPTYVCHRLHNKLEMEWSCNCVSAAQRLQSTHARTPSPSITAPLRLPIRVHALCRPPHIPPLPRPPSPHQSACALSCARTSSVVSHVCVCVCVCVCVHARLQCLRRRRRRWGADPPAEVLEEAKGEVLEEVKDEVKGG